MDTIKRYDSFTLPRGKGVRNKDGYLKIDEAVVSRIGIFEYMNNDGSIRRELRHPAEVFKKQSLDTLKGRPITLDHPIGEFVDSKNVSTLGKGMTGDKVEVDGNLVVVPLTITHEDAINAVYDGVDELSLGYTLRLDMTSGMWEGQPYDAIQRDITYNHVAIVPTARAGAITKINADAGFKPKEKKRMDKVNIDGISYDAAPEVKNALDKANKALTTLNATIDGLKGEKEALVSEKTKVIDGLKGELEAAKAETEKLAQSIDGLVKERVQLEKVAEKFNVAFDGLSELDIKKEIAKTVAGNVDFADKTAEYVQPLFDLAVANLDKGSNDALKKCFANDGKQEQQLDGHAGYTATLVAAING